MGGHWKDFVFWSEHNGKLLEAFEEGQVWLLFSKSQYVKSKETKLAAHLWQSSS